MLCYKDRMFCKDYQECRDGKRCPIALTPEVEAGAKRCGLPIAQNIEKESCFKQVVRNG